MDENKKIIIDLFRQNVKGKTCDTSKYNDRHDGKKGHWLEEQFCIPANASNSADILGYELKNETRSKTTFGDWSANRYIFRSGNFYTLFDGLSQPQKQDSFCRIFGKPNVDKGGRFSWSGSPCPHIGGYNDFGQILVVEDNLDITVRYSFSKNKRTNKNAILPADLQRDDIVLAHWFGLVSPSEKNTDKCLKSKLEDKFNDKGWFTCKTDDNGVYDRICFGKAISYDVWINLVREGVVFFDSGMYESNSRPYSQWRANNSFWNSLITETYY